jgi:hypothetical protein
MRLARFTVLLDRSLRRDALRCFHFVLCVIQQFEPLDIPLVFFVWGSWWIAYSDSTMGKDVAGRGYIPPHSIPLAREAYFGPSAENSAVLREWKTSCAYAKGRNLNRLTKRKRAG